MTMKAKYGNYLAGVEDITGIDAPMLPTDKDIVYDALQYMDAALTEAQAIKTEDSSLWSRLKASLTSVQLDSAKAEVDTFAKAAASMHDTATRLLADPNTTHARIIDFVRGCYEVSDISALKGSANRNKLSSLVDEVSKATAADLVSKSEGLVKAAASGIWDNLSTPGKVGLVVGIPVGIFLLWKLK